MSIWPAVADHPGSQAEEDDRGTHRADFELSEEILDLGYGLRMLIEVVPILGAVLFHQYGFFMGEVIAGGMNEVIEQIISPRTVMFEHQ